MKNKSNCLYLKDSEKEEFDKVHELNHYYRNNVVDKRTNQKVEQYSIGEGSFLKCLSSLDDNDYIKKMKLSDEKYYFIFKHGEAIVKIEGYKEWSHNDLIQVDFKSKTMNIIKDFFEDENGKS